MFVTLLSALLSGIALTLLLTIAAIAVIGLFHGLPGYLQQRWGYAPPAIVQPKPLLQRWIFLFTQGAGALMLTFSTTPLQQALLLPVIVLLLALAIIDWQRQWLPDSLTLSLLWYGLLVNQHDNFVPLTDAVLGAVAGYLSLWLLNAFYRYCYRQDGLGHGDFKLLAALGAWIGWGMLPMLVAGAASIGLGVTLYNDLQAKNYAFWRKRPPLPFGLYLALSGWLCLLWVAYERSRLPSLFY